MTVQHSTLSNGIRVVSEAMPHLETASVGVWVDVGARYEDQAINGISHMLEHMAFKGTTTRSARRIAEEIENAGGYLNAYTTREHTTYYARDRKSTRLNSSHITISYAVFCLKKKRANTRATTQTNRKNVDTSHETTNSIHAGV